MPRQLRGLSWLFQSRGECDRDCPRQCPRHPSRDVSRRGLLACLLLALSLLVRTLLTREDTSHIHSFTHVSLLTRPEHEKRIALPSHLVSSGFDHSIPIFLSIHPTATSRCIRTEHILTTDVSLRFMYTSTAAHGGAECSSSRSGTATGGASEWCRRAGSNGASGATAPAATPASDARERQCRASSSRGTRAAASNQCGTSTHVRWGACQR